MNRLNISGVLLIKKVLNSKFNAIGGNFKTYSLNTFWLLSEKIFRLSINLIVAVWIARYLGPEEFGLFNFAVSFATICFPLINFGLHGILVKELYNTKTEKESNVILGSSFALKSFMGCLGFVVMLLNWHYNWLGDQSYSQLLLLVSFSFLFQSFTVLESWFESKAENKIPVLLKSILFFVGSVLKIILILEGYELPYFLLVYSLEFLLTGVGLILAYVISGGSILHWKVKVTKIKELVRNSWFLVFSSISAVIYLKIDQLMLIEFAGEMELGYYSAAVRLSESWYFVPVVVMNALFPMVLKAKNKGEDNFYQKLADLSNVFVIISLGIALMVNLLSEPVILYLYGDEYKSSVLILQLHIWAGVFIAQRAILSKWIISNEVYWFSLFSQVSGAVLNIILNLILIPLYGGVGAAVATIISYATTTIIVLIFFKRTHRLLKIFTNSFINPFRIEFYKKLFKEVKVKS